MKGVFFFLGELNDQDIEWLLKRGRKQDLQPGTDLVQEGKPIDQMHFILAGGFRYSVARLGAEAQPVGVGEVIGEVSFVDSRPPTGTITALTPSVVLSIPRPVLAAKLQDDVPFAARFYRALSMMLAYRHRQWTTRQEGAGDPAAADQLDTNLLDTLHLAGARFNRILTRLLGA